MPRQAPPPALCLEPSPTSGVRCNGLPAQRDLAYDVIMPAERQAGEGPSQGPLPRPWRGGCRCQWLGGQVLCFGVSCFPSDAQISVPSTHTPPCPRPIRRRPDGGNPGASARCTPPPRRGSGSARRLLSCKRGHGGVFGPHKQQIPGDTHTHTHTHPELLKHKYSYIYTYTYRPKNPDIELQIHTQTITHTQRPGHTHTHTHTHTQKQTFTDIPRKPETQRDTCTHIQMLICHFKNF